MTNLITEARELCAAATPGPWGYDGMHNEVHCHEDYFLIVSELRESPHEELLDEFGHTYNPNFALIARSRSLIPELADALEKAERENGRLKSLNHSAGAIIARLEEAHRWIPVAERLPERNDRILAYTPPKPGHAELCEVTRGFMAQLGKRSGVTHWLPLPEPPQKGD